LRTSENHKSIESNGHRTRTLLKHTSFVQTKLVKVEDGHILEVKVAVNDFKFGKMEPYLDHLFLL
jgi:hypothetical protein